MQTRVLIMGLGLLCVLLGCPDDKEDDTIDDDDDAGDDDAGDDDVGDDDTGDDDTADDDTGDDDVAGYTYRADLTGDETLPATRDPNGQDVNPFAQFDKYQVQLYWFRYDAAHPVKEGTSTHILLNRALDDGVTVDLANENLSDVLDTDQLLIEDAIGNSIANVQIGFGSTFVVRGYAYDEAGTLLRTTAGGFVEGDGPAEDYEIPAISMLDTEGWWDSPQHGEEVPLNTDLVLVELSPFNIGPLLGGDPITVEEEEVLQFRFPVDLGAQFCTEPGVGWTSVDVNVATPYIESSMDFEKYYYRRTDFPYYTELLKLLFDSNGFLVPGQGQGIPYIYFSDNNATDQAIFYMPLYVDQPEPDIIAEYNAMFEINPNGSIRLTYINSAPDDPPDAPPIVEIPEFFRSAVGEERETTLYNHGVPVEITYVRVE